MVRHAQCKTMRVTSWREILEAKYNKSHTKLTQIQSALILYYAWIWYQKFSFLATKVFRRDVFTRQPLSHTANKITHVVVFVFCLLQLNEFFFSGAIYFCSFQTRSDFYETYK